MARSIPAGLMTALTQSVIEPFYAIEMIFDTMPVRFWTGIGDRTLEGNTYTGAGGLLSISDLEEIGDLSAKSASVTISGISTDIVALALVEPYQRRPCRILFGCAVPALLPDGLWDDYSLWDDSLLWNDAPNDVIEMFSGKMNTMTIEDAPDSATITLTIESRLIELQRAKTRRYNHESHISRYPGDTFFATVADLQDRQVTWGRKQA